jgi:hypothetical protein
MVTLLASHGFAYNAWAPYASWGNSRIASSSSSSGYGLDIWGGASGVGYYLSQPANYGTASSSSGYYGNASSGYYGNASSGYYDMPAPVASSSGYYGAPTASSGYYGGYGASSSGYYGGHYGASSSGWGGPSPAASSSGYQGYWPASSSSSGYY